MARRQAIGDTVTRISIPNTLSVSRQATNKRQQQDAETIDNALVTLERNFEKRSGFTIVPQDTIAGLASTGWDFSSNNVRLDLFELSNLVNNDLWFYWYNINEETKFLICVNFDAVGKDQQLIYTYQLLTNNTWKNVSMAAQWDPTDPEIANATVGNANNSTVVQAYASANNISYAAAVALGTVTRATRAYITFGTGTKTSRESLKAVTLGSSFVILNTNVFAGFSSDINGKLFNLDGTPSNNNDIRGRKVTYFSAAKVIKVFDPGPDNTQNTTDDIFLGYNPDSVNGSYISVDDYLYYKPGLAFLGQLVNDASVIKLPPQKDDWFSNNTNITTGDTKAQQMLAALYDSTHPLKNITGGVGGRGKIVKTLNSFLNLIGGYYRYISFPDSEIYGYGASAFPATNMVVGKAYLIVTPGTTLFTNHGAANNNVGTTFVATSVGTGTGTVKDAVVGAGNPYLQKVRTPDEWSYIDPNRMPHRVTFNISNASPIFSIGPMNWKPRESGTRDSNPGPSIFRTVDGNAIKQVRIRSISVFKDRLWLSADDVVFSSALGEYEQFFINDPTNIVDSDPIDIRASSNTYAEVVSMSPFEDYLFVNTKANIQFQLMTAGGEGTTLSPTNVSISPVTYYSTALFTDPQTIGSQLYFYDNQRLYLYMGKNKLGFSSAIEVSYSVTGYLPKNYKATCSAPSHDSVLTVDNDSPNNIYFYTARFSGERVIQSSFYRFVLSDTSNIQTLQSHNSYLYAVVKNNNKFFLQRTNLLPDAVNVPRLDDVFEFTTRTTNPNPNTVYDATTNTTVFKIPQDLPITNNSYIIFGTNWSNEIPNTAAQGTVEIPANQNYKQITVIGNYSENGKTIFIGNSYTMNVTLSPVVVRDQNGSIVEGTLSVRSGVIRHSNSGPYSVSVSSRSRPALVSSFFPNWSDIILNEDSFPLDIVDVNGEFTFKVFGFSDSTIISILSDGFTPVNITNIDFRGKFKQKSNTVNT
jgi:hypothetical protein